MATREFTSEKFKYTPDSEVRRIGKSGRVWDRWEIVNNAGLYKGALFIPNKSTKAQIIKAFNEYLN